MSSAREATWKPRSEMKVLNRDIPRLDGPDKATGRAVYHEVGCFACHGALEDPEVFGLVSTVRSVSRRTRPRWR